MSKSLVALLLLLCVPTAQAQPLRLTGTTLRGEHGMLTVMGTDCHQYIFNIPDNVDGWSQAITAWGRSHHNVTVLYHKESGPLGPSLVLNVVYPSDAASVIPKCAAASHTMSEYVDGVIEDWSAGNENGGFSVRTRAGAERDFTFNLRDTPRINGRQFYCGDLQKRFACDDMSNVLHAGVTRIRVFYQVVDSPDGANIVPLRILTLENAPY